MEWTVVTVIIALVGLFAILVPPIVKLNTSITRLTVVMENHSKALDNMETKNAEEHKVFCEAINNHDKRIYAIEKSK